MTEAAKPVTQLDPNVAADLAMQQAERLLRADKRRHIGAVIYQDAVPC